MQHPNTVVHVALDNNRDIAAEVGLLLSCYKLIELYMFVVFEKLSDSSRDESKAILGSVSGFNQRMDILRNLLNDTNDSDVDKGFSAEIFDRVEECSRIRNKYTHSIYSQPSVTSEEEWRIGSWFGDVRKINFFEYISLESIRNERNILRKTIRDLNYFGNLLLPNT
ncbi:MAG: hypothetical protein GY896_14860 [Gammaproteobacteria bacterium]|nr:hypothetical protein [Gammaproteobacteria bacterium]